MRFRWNQGPSNVPGYPLDLNAGYHLLLLDIDAQPDDTFDDEHELDAALRQIQEVQMLPADDLLLQPSDTLRTGQWEAWYPSAIRRQRTDEQMAALRSQNRRGPWYSWRESRLVWPPCPSRLYRERRAIHSDGGCASVPGAPGQQLGEKPLAGRSAGKPGHIVALQPPPAIQPNTWATFVENTNPKNDPYGWAVLQRLGLSVTFSLRDDQTGDLLKGADLLEGRENRPGRSGEGGRPGRSIIGHAVRYLLPAPVRRAAVPAWQEHRPASRAAPKPIACWR